MSSEVAICNLALARIGVSEGIESLEDDQSTEARVCNRLFAAVRDSLLRSFPWSFAMRDVALALVAEYPVSGWRYSYRQPADCLRIWALNPSRYQTVTVTPMGSGSDELGRLIYCDVEEAVLRYVHRVTDVARWDVLFQEAVAWRLARELTMPLAIDRSLTAMAAEGEAAAIDAARAVMLNEEYDERPESEFIRARGP